MEQAVQTCSTFYAGGGGLFSVSSVSLPDRVGRAVWLLLESRKQDQVEVRYEAVQKVRAKTWEGQQ